MRVVIVEDDYLQGEEIVLALRNSWPQIEIEMIETEWEFRNKLPTLLARPPHVVIMDVMLRWTNPSPDMEPRPEDVKAEGPNRAGVRCINLLRQNETVNHIPIIVYSMFGRREVGEISESLPNVFFLEKDPVPDRLIQRVGSLIAAQIPTKQSSATIRDVFICHASEDKETIVDPIVRALEDSGITVWHDRAEIRWGDSLISKVEEGLRISRYVLAILSKHSVTKPWPRRELHAALNREASTGEVKVLPLIVGSAEERAAILLECALQNDKLYEVWTGSPTLIVQRLKQRLR